MEETGHEVQLVGLVQVVTVEGRDGGPPSIGFIFYGELGEQVGEPEGSLHWFGACDLLAMSARRRGELFLPGFQLEGFWRVVGSRAFLPVDAVISDRVWPREDPRVGIPIGLL